MNKKLSIIIPFYNSINNIEDLLRDLFIIFGQDSNEFLFLDDGSTDGTSEYLEAISEEKNLFNIKVFLNKNMGQAEERNFGLEKATGDFILFLDSDDAINISGMKKIYAYFMNHSEANDLFIFGYSKIVNGIQSNRTLNDCIQDNDKIKHLFFEYKKDPIGGYVWNKIIKKSLIENIKFYNMKYEDVPFIFSIVKKAESIVYLPITGYHYVYHANSTVNVITDNLVLDRIKSLEMVNNIISDDNDINNAFFAYRINTFIYLWYKSNNNKIRTIVRKHLCEFDGVSILANNKITFKNKTKYLLIRLLNLHFWRV